MQIPQGRSAQIKKLKRQTGFKIQFYIGIQLTWSVFVILGHFGQSQRALVVVSDSAAPVAKSGVNQIDKCETKISNQTD